MWIESHLSYDEASAQGYPKLHWIVNRYADELASRAADSFALSGDQLDAIKQQTGLALSILRRQVELAIELAPAKHKYANRTDEVAIIPSKVSKEDLVRKWAMASGHVLNSTLRCQNCFMQVPIAKNVGFLESILYMPCLGDGTGRDRQHSLDATSNEHYMFGKVKVHSSHLMATKGSLGVHFCMHCGAHGTNRSNHLKLSCPHRPTKAGLEALRLLRLGRKPSCFLEASVETERQNQLKKHEHLLFSSYAGNRTRVPYRITT